MLLAAQVAAAAHVGHNARANANKYYLMDAVPWAGGEKAPAVGAVATIKKVGQE